MVGIKRDIMSSLPREATSLREDQNSMSMKTKAAILVSSAAVLVFVVVGGLNGVRASNNDGSYHQIQVYSEVL
jgi:hypothetical protein